VHEAEPADGVSIRHELRAALPDEVMPSTEFLATDLHVRQVLAQSRRHGDCGKLGAGDAGGFEDALVASVEVCARARWSRR
jgi:hypothetical protein